MSDQKNTPTQEEKTEQTTEERTSETLSDTELDSVSGGAFPTAVNNQITDAVTQ